MSDYDLIVRNAQIGDVKEIAGFAAE